MQALRFARRCYGEHQVKAAFWLVRVDKDADEDDSNSNNGDIPTFVDGDKPASLDVNSGDGLAISRLSSARTVESEVAMSIRGIVKL